MTHSRRVNSSSPSDGSQNAIKILWISESGRLWKLARSLAGSAGAYGGGGAMDDMVSVDLRKLKAQ